MAADAPANMVPPASHPARIVAIIPARWGSTRFPGKPLVKLAGVPLVVRVMQQVSKTPGLEGVYVATDDQRIADCVRHAGGRALMTRADHPSGTDRLAEAVEQLPAADWVLNVQGDEPLLNPQQLAVVVARIQQLETTPPRQAARSSGAAVTPPSLSRPILTLVTPLAPADLARRSVVKAVRAHTGQALYFSRAPVPAPASPTQPAAVEQQTLPAGLYWRHIGLYAFHRLTLQEVAALEPSPLEQHEQLEQLRWLEAGHRLEALLSPTPPGPAVDTPEDVQRVEAALAADR